MTESLYRKYLAADGAMKRLEAVGIDTRNLSAHLSTDSSYWRKRADEELAAGEQPHIYQWGEVQIHVDFAVAAWNMSDEAAREAREGRAHEFLRRFPDAKLARSQGTAMLYFEPLIDVGVTIYVGQGFCEQVQVGTKTVTRKDPELLGKLAEALPDVEVEEPVMEWRCNDADLIGM